MEIISHITGFLSTRYFKAANAGYPIHPFVIPEGVELVEVLTAGEVFFEVDGRKQRFSRGTIFWHIAGESTIWDTTLQAPYQCATFRFGVSCRKRVLPRVFQWRNSSQSLEDFIRYSRSWYESSPDDPLLGNYCLMQLVAQTAAPAEVNCSLTAPDSRIAPNSKLFHLLQYMEEHISDALDVEILGKTAGISRNQLFREFKAHLQMTPHGYLQERRIVRARQLLETGTLPIKEIAELCGFENIEVFYRSFKKSAGMPPAVYRRQFASHDFLLK